MDIHRIREQIIGSNTWFQTPYGQRRMTYADYTASGRNLAFIESYLMKLEESYANTHTEDNYSGHQMTLLYHEAKARIRTLLGGDQDYSIIFTGSGATGAIHKLTQILGIYEAPATKARCNKICDDLSEASDENKKVIDELKNENNKRRPVVFTTAYEHHSNVLTWREGDCEVHEIDLDAEGTLDLEDLRKQVSDPKYKNRMKIGAFSAASNVTGMISPVCELADMMHEYGGYAFFDYAASGPYVAIKAKRNENCYIDGLYFSPHKFLGGPGSPGVLMFHKRIYNESLAPTCAGGGTVTYVNSETQDYKDDIESREDAGTPAILQALRTALVLELKHSIGYETIETLENRFLNQALSVFHAHPNILLVGQEHPYERLAIVSFNIRYKEGMLHPRFVTRLLNDLFGIQARAGCSCAGPYGHRLLGIDETKSNRYREVILEGFETMKPGWVRINFHYTLDEYTLAFLLKAIIFIAEYGYLFLSDYILDAGTGLWVHKNEEDNSYTKLSLADAWLYENEGNHASKPDVEEISSCQMTCIKEAYLLKDTLLNHHCTPVLFGVDRWPDLAWFYVVE